MAFPSGLTLTSKSTVPVSRLRFDSGGYGGAGLCRYAGSKRGGVVMNSDALLELPTVSRREFAPGDAAAAAGVLFVCAGAILDAGVGGDGVV